MEFYRSTLLWVTTTWPFFKSQEEVDASPSPRIFYSHVPYQMAVGGDPERNKLCKHIYLARNPKDVCLSYYYFETGQKWAGCFNCPWDKWFQMFMQGRVQRGSWFDNVLSWWQHRHAENILFLK